MAAEVRISCGAFELVEEVGSGGMGTVWRAKHGRNDVRAAVKIVGRGELAREGLDAEEFHERFRREVRTHAKLQHPAVIGVLDYGRVTREEAETSEGRLAAGQPYVAMEFADGGTVRDHVPLSRWEEVAELVRQVLDGLAYVHARDIVHRDLKPENILLQTLDGGADIAEGYQFKLADFGLAHAFDALGIRARHDHEGEELGAGTPSYMAPEQFRRKWRRFGPWTDLYQLGVVVWELVCGERPFEAESPLGFAYQHAKQPLPAFQPRFAVPPRLGTWLSGLLAKAPENRFQRVADAAWQFEQFQNVEREEGDVESLGGEWASGLEGDAVGEASESEPTVSDYLGTTLPGVQFTSGFLEPPSSRSETARPQSGGGSTLGSTETRPLETPIALPQSWARPVTSHRPGRTVEAGLALFDLREIPFVDRERERESLWNQLGVMLESGASRVAVIEGASGAGKTRLAQWFSRRAHEAGVCTVLRADHEENAGTDHGIVDLVERYFRAWDVDRESAYETALEILDAVAGFDPAFDREVLELDARAYVEVMRPGTFEGEGEPEAAYHFDSRSEVHAALSRLLGYVGARRPACVWLDDVQWGPETLSWVEWHLDQADTPPAMFVLTFRADEFGEAVERSRSRVENLAEDGRVERIELEPLSRSDHRRMVERFLPLERELVEIVCERTEGNPLFARQLVGDWVERGQLELDAGRFRRVGEASMDVPEAIHNLWVQRLAGIAEYVPDGREGDVWATLEIGAVLGRSVDAEEWRAACAQAGVDPVEGLFDQIAEIGLAEAEADGWRFVHAMLVESLRKLARERGRLEAHHEACARMLSARDARLKPGIRARCAEHQAASGALEPAIETLFGAIEEACEIEAMDRVQTYVERQAELLDAAGIGDDDIRRARNERWRAEWWAERDLEQAEAIADRLSDRFSADEHPVDLAALRLLQAKFAYTGGKLRESYEMLEGLVEPTVAAGAYVVAGRIEGTRGYALHLQGEFDGAEQHYRESTRLYRRGGDDVRVRRGELSLALLAIDRNEFEAAERLARDIRERAREDGDTSMMMRAWNTLGEAARFQGRFERAQHCYRRALQTGDRLAQERLSVSYDLNVALTEIALGAFAESAKRLAGIAEKLERTGDVRTLSTVRAARVACVVGEGQWHRWDEQFDRLLASLGETGYRHRDQPWVVDIAAELAAEAGEVERAVTLYRLERELWAALDQDGEVRRVDAAIASLDG